MVKDFSRCFWRSDEILLRDLQQGGWPVGATSFLLLIIWYSKKNVLCFSKYLLKSGFFSILSNPQQDQRPKSSVGHKSGLFLHLLLGWLFTGFKRTALFHTFLGLSDIISKHQSHLTLQLLLCTGTFKNMAVIISFKLRLACTLSRKENNWNIIKKNSLQVSCGLPMRQGGGVISSSYTVQPSWEHSSKNEGKTCVFH